MQLHWLYHSYRFFYPGLCALSLIACLLLPAISWAEADVNSPSNKTSSPIPDDVTELINAYRYDAAFKRVEILLKTELISEQDAQTLLSRIEKESIIHSRINIKTAYQLSRQYRWAEADALLSTLSKQVRDKEPVTEAKTIVRQTQHKHLLKQMSNAALQKQSWLQQQHEFNQLQNRSTQRNLFSRAQRRWTKSKLKKQNSFLLKLAIQNHDIEEYSTSQRCLEAVDPEQLTDKKKSQYEALTALTFPNRPVTATVENKETITIKNKSKSKGNTPISKEHKPDATIPVNVLVNLLEKNMRDNNLLAIKLNLIELAPVTSNQSLHKPLVDQAEILLANEILKLDQAADDFYRTEQPLEAYEIWEFLLQLDSGNTAIQQKFDRAKIVLGNMEALRAQGSTNTSPDIQ